jgi:hypothetical protein
MNAITVAKFVVNVAAQVAAGHVAGRVIGHTVVEAIEPGFNHDKLPMDSCLDRAAHELAKPLIEGVRNARELVSDFRAFREQRARRLEDKALAFEKAALDLGIDPYEIATN